MNNIPLHCACLIHGDLYKWEYVEKLHNMIVRNTSRPVTLHVYTESSRHVPAPMIKHELEDWGFSGPRQSWWYKLQMFNSQHYQGPLLYFDLDVVLVDNIDWIVEQNTEYFWGIRDFNYLWKVHAVTMNSSVMWWDTTKFNWIWENVDINNILKKYRGDQDYITDVLKGKNIRFLDQSKVQSWRWQAFDGGYDFSKKTWKNRGAGTNIQNTSILVFHGNPKPHEVNDATILNYWR